MGKGRSDWTRTRREFAHEELAPICVGDRFEQANKKRGKERPWAPAFRGLCESSPTVEALRPGTLLGLALPRYGDSPGDCLPSEPWR